MTVSIPRIRRGLVVAVDIVVEASVVDGSTLLTIVDERRKREVYGVCDRGGGNYRLLKRDGGFYDVSVADVRCCCKGFESMGLCKHLHAARLLEAETHGSN